METGKELREHLFGKEDFVKEEQPDYVVEILQQAAKKQKIFYMNCDKFERREKRNEKILYSQSSYTLNLKMEE